MTTVAITQPPYYGWTGFWALAQQADTLVLLDTVAISRQSWQTRNRIRLPNGDVRWLSIPCHSRLNQQLHTVEIADNNWARKHWATIQTAYMHAPHFRELDWLQAVYENPATRLTEFTTTVILRLAHQLAPNTTIVSASKLELPQPKPGPDTKTERLNIILDHLHADTYLTTTGATYLNGHTHIGATVIERLHHTPTAYPQGPLSWQPHLAIVDAVAWNGAEQTRRLLQQTRAVSRLIHSHLLPSG